MCVSENGSDGLCADGTALLGASSVVVAPDGRQVFVTAEGIGGVTAYARDADTGALDAAELPARQGAQGRLVHERARWPAPRRARSRPDGKTLIVASTEDQALALFARNADTGALTPSGCVKHQDPQGDDAVDAGGGGLRGRGGRRGGAGRLHAGEGALRPARGRRLLRRPRRLRGRRRLAGGVPARPRLGRRSRRPAARRPSSATSRARRRATLFEPRGHRGVVRRALALRDEHERERGRRCSPPRWRSRAAPRRRDRARALQRQARLPGRARAGLRGAPARRRRERAQVPRPRGRERAVKARLGKRLRRVVRKRGRVRVTVAARDSRGLTRAPRGGSCSAAPAREGPPSRDPSPRRR